MKQYSAIKFLIGIIVVCFSCKEPARISGPFDWLNGTWEMRRTAGGSRFEMWSQNNDGSFSGKGIRVEGNDTFLLEKIELIARDKDFYYVATVPDQNNGQPIEFKLTRTEGLKYTFENPKHDFPQRIIYLFAPRAEDPQLVSSPRDSLLVRVESFDGTGVSYGFAKQ